MIPKAKWLAGTLTTLGVVASLFIGGRAGLAGAVICFGAGLWYLGSHSNFRIRLKRQEMQPLLDAGVGVAPKQPTEVLLTVKEVHAYSPSEIGEEGLATNPKLDLEVFVHAWLVSETEAAVGIKNCELKIAASDGSIRTTERIAGDLQKWLLDTDKEQSDMWDTHIERVRERLVELNTSGLLECGAPRDGWLHFIIRNISPSEYKTAAMELSVEDSSSLTHIGIVNCTRHLSGQVERSELGDPPHISPVERHDNTAPMASV